MEKRVKIAFACDYGMRSGFYAERIVRELPEVDVDPVGISLLEDDPSKLELDFPAVVFKLTPTFHSRFDRVKGIKWVEPAELRKYRAETRLSDLPHEPVLRAVRKWLEVNGYFK